MEHKLLSPHPYSSRIENGLEDILHCERGALGGVIDADVINHLPYMSIMLGLAVVFNNHPEKADLIQEFGNEYYYLLSYSMDQIWKEYGEEYIETMIDKFETIANLL